MTLRRVLLIGGVVAVVLVAAVFAGWWFFIREDAELATEPPAIPEELLQATEVPSPVSDGGGTPEGAGAADVLTFRIIPTESEAAYFVGEKLANLPLPSTAKGTTNDIDGEFHLTGDGTALASGAESQFTVDLRTLTSDESRRDDRVQGALETDLYPTATFTVSDVSGYDPAIPEGEEQTLMLTGTLDLHGVQREVTWEVQARRESDVITALATLTVAFADFDITPPNIAGFVSVEDQATLQVQLIAQVA
jgi:polyisoprenoid-binding protein YceI